MRVWYIVLSFSTKVVLILSMSRKVSGALRMSPSAICPSMILLTSAPIVSSVYSLRLREAASTESAIIRIAVSRVKGFGPG